MTLCKNFVYTKLDFLISCNVRILLFYRFPVGLKIDQGYVHSVGCHENFSLRIFLNASTYGCSLNRTEHEKVGNKIELRLNLVKVGCDADDSSR